MSSSCPFVTSSLSTDVVGRRCAIENAEMIFVGSDRVRVTRASLARGVWRLRGASEIRAGRLGRRAVRPRGGAPPPGAAVGTGPGGGVFAPRGEGGGPPGVAAPRRREF